MKKSILAVPCAILVFSILACAKASPEQIRKFTATPSTTPTSAPTITQTPRPVSTEKPILAETTTLDPFHQVSILAAFLNVRMEPNGVPSGNVLQSGDSVMALCIERWCELESGGYIWRGCTDDNPMNLGCEQK